MAQEFRSLRTTAQSIGFHELRQALEISSLKQDLERVARDTDDLRAHIEDAVEEVRTRFAALTPEELADASHMAPLLQAAVKSLLDIRDAARRIEVNSGPMADADRPDPPPLSLLHAARPEAVHPAEPPPAPIPAPTPLPQPRQTATTAPQVTAAPSAASWLNQPSAPPSRTPPNADRPARSAAPKTAVAWLGPPRR